MFKTLSSSPMSRYFALWVSLFLIATPSVAQVKNEDTPTRPKVAVVLAGGGAKGAAHIGVLKALEEMHIPVDIITGTSMGAYVGGLYATGMSADEIESFIYSVDWNSGYRDRVDRSQRRVRDKEYEDRYQITTDLGLRFGEVRAPTGVVQGQNMLRVLRETTGNLGRFESFDELAIPYRSVATDILELDEVVIGNGYLVDAMMASMSVPGALPPYKLNGHMLVDGGVVNNMPVDVARAMGGADVVIAVDISTDYKTEDDFTGLFTVADQLSNYLVRRSTQQQVETLQEHDVYIRPNVGQMETVEFDKMPWAFQSGYDITKEMESKLAGLRLSNAEYQKYIDHKQEVRKKLVYGDDRVVDEIVIVNNTHYSDVLLTNRLELETGRKIETAEIEKAVENLYALDRFELITYHFEEVDGSNLLVFDVNEKSWGPNYLNFRFFLEDDFDTDSQYGIGMSTNFTNLNSHGAEMALNVEMGTDKLIEAELYSPVLSSQEFFVAGKVAYSSEGRNLPVSDDDSSFSSVNDFLPVSYTEFVSEIAIGIQPTLWQELRLGGRYSSGSIELSTLASVGNLDFERRGLFANYRLDTLDDFAFPTRGLLVDLEYLVSHDTSPEEIGQSKPKDIVEDTVYEIDARFKGAMSYQRHTLVGQAEYSFVQSKNSSITLDPRELGGFLHLSGIPRNSLIGQNLFFSSLVYRYKWFDNDFGLFEAPVYVGASLEHGGTWSDNDLKLNEAPLYNAASIFFGVDSPIGPIMLAYGRTEQDMEAVYLIVGTSFK
ncbi:patatin-like phospholipase family protein [Vibrio parahaemolyticus]|nr:patatin-like phospholipase family protein [Vibrio parahaemolyticus]